MSDTARALVLRSTDYSETSLIVTVLTDTLGLLRTIAKGAKRPGSRLNGGLSLFSLSRVQVYRKKSGLHILGEADLESAFPTLGESLESYFSAHFASELLLGMLPADQPAAPVFDSAEEVFGRLSRGENRPLAILAFQAALLQHTGHMVETERCVECGGHLPRGGSVPFSPAAGGGVCADCPAAPRLTWFEIRTGTLALVARLLTYEGRDLTRVRIPEASRAELTRVFGACFESIMERKLRTARFLATATG